MPGTKPTSSLIRVIPALIHVQAHLDQDLSLDLLAKIRFDCCIQVPEVFDVDGDIACQRTSGGEHAITDYVGSWDLQPAYAAILERLRSNSTVEVIGLPAIEIYQTTRIGQRYGLAQVSIAIPVKSRTDLSNGDREKQAVKG